MPRSRIPSYRLHSRSGQAVVTLNGHDHYLGVFDTPESHNRYEQLIAEWLANGRQLPSVEQPGSLTITELLAGYLSFAEIYYHREGQATSEYVAVRDALKPVRSLYGTVRVRDFGPLALKTVREQMIKNGLSRKHINLRVNRIRRCFRWGVENELVPPSVLEGLRALAPLKKGRTSARETDPIGPVPLEHVEAVFPQVSRQVSAMIQLQLLSGMRPGEVCQMRPGNLDRTSNIWIYRPDTHKTDYRDLDRTVYLGPRAQAILIPFLDRAPEVPCFSPIEAEAERNAARRVARQTKMTPSQSARKPQQDPKRTKRTEYDTCSYRRAIEYGIKKAGVPHWHPHQLRHTCGTRVRADFGLDVAQIILGHQSCDVSQVYAVADRKRAIQVMETTG